MYRALALEPNFQWQNGMDFRRIQPQNVLLKDLEPLCSQWFCWMLPLKDIRSILGQAMRIHPN